MSLVVGSFEPVSLPLVIDVFGLVNHPGTGGWAKETITVILEIALTNEH